MSFRWSAGRKVVLWEGTFAAKEATWSFVAAIFFDPYKDNLRVFAFNSHGRRHMGLLAKLASRKARLENERIETGRPQGEICG